MKRFAYLLVVVLVIIAAFLTVGNRETKKKTTSKSPKLVVGIVIDQMRYDYLYRYYDQYGDDGFKRLLNKGFTCENHHFSYKPTKTGPGHASIYSGTTPAIHGIIANDWWMKDEKRMTYCVEDNDVEPVGTTDPKERRSPKNILVTNLSDEIKLATSYKGKIISISGKDRGAVLPGGKLADGAYWLTDSGKFVSSTYYMDELPLWLQAFNDSNLVDDYLTKGWNTLLPIEEYWQSNEDDSPYEGDMYGRITSPTFPYDLKAISDKQGDASVLKETPFSNSLINDLALVALEKENLGQDEFTDMFSISYSSPDYIGHNYGPRAIEIQDTYLRLDQELAHLFNELDKKVGEGNYLVFLTADHGASFVTQELIDKKVNVDYFERDTFDLFVANEINKKYGMINVVESITNHQIFLNEKAIKESDIELKKVEEFLAKKIMEFPGVYISNTSSDMLLGGYTDQRLMLQKGYNQKRSGNVLFLLNPGWRRFYEITGTSHGSTYTYDTHVPFILYGWNIPHGSTTRRTWVEDIAPTITSLLHVNYPMGATGNPVWELNEARR